MKRRALLLLFTLSLVAAVPARAADVFLLGFTGFDYEDPNTNASVPLDVGEGYKGVGFVTSFGTMLTPYVDTTNNEYTFYLYDLTVSLNYYDGSFLEADFASGGRGRYFGDSKAGGTAATYGTSPPNGTAPSTFIDGNLELGGSIDNFILTYDYTTNQGNFSGNMTLDEGALLVYVPSGQRAGWILGGLAGEPNSTVPTGYVNQVSGECRIPDATPTTQETWGGVKALYRSR